MKEPWDVQDCEGKPLIYGDVIERGITPYKVIGTSTIGYDDVAFLGHIIDSRPVEPWCAKACEVMKV